MKGAEETPATLSCHLPMKGKCLPWMRAAKGAEKDPTGARLCQDISETATAFVFAAIVPLTPPRRAQSLALRAHY